MRHKREWLTCDVCGIDIISDPDVPAVGPYIVDIVIKQHNERGIMVLEHFCDHCKQAIIQALTQCEWKYQSREKNI
jgi:uncharacterized protein YwlG (UPF0340 family)